VQQSHELCTKYLNDTEQGWKQSFC
jgi:hypothetical protein